MWSFFRGDEGFKFLRQPVQMPFAVPDFLRHRIELLADKLTALFGGLFPLAR